MSRTSRLIGVNLACAAALVLASCSNDSSPGSDNDTSSQTATQETDSGSQSATETQDTDSQSATSSATDTETITDTASSTSTDTFTDTNNGTDTGTESETEVVMSLIDVIPSAASRSVTTEVAVLGYSILEGATVTMVNCDTSAEIDITSMSTVAVDGQSIAIILPADESRVQGLYTISVTNPAPMEHQNDELVCAFSVLSGTPPTVTSVTPTTAFAGTAGDGVLSDTLVNIEGTGFTATPSVRWVMADGSRQWEADEVAFVSDTELTAVVPSESGKMEVGDYHVYVTNPDKLGARWLVDGAAPGVFTITGNPPPRIDDVQPPRVEQSACTSQTLAIEGANFDVDAQVFYMIETGTCTDQVIDANGSILCPMTVDSATATDLSTRFASCPGNGIWPIAVMNPDGQVDYFFSILITNSSDGHLNDGAFEPLSAQLVTPRWRHTAEYGFDALGRANIYVAGGQDAAGNVLDTVEVSQLSVFGRPGPFATILQYLNEEDVRVTNTLSIPRQGAAMVRVGRDFFVLGGAPLRTDVTAVVSATDSVERARILGYDEMPSVKKATSQSGQGLPIGTWFYRVSALGPWGEGLATKEMAVYGGSGEVTVCWGVPSQAGVTGYNVYRSQAADGRSGTTSLIATNVQGTCFEDKGEERLAPAPGRLRGTPATGTGLTADTYSYVVTAVVPVAGGDPFETLASYQANIQLRQEDIDAGNGALQLTWDQVPGTDVTYYVYRLEPISGELIRLEGGPLVSPDFLDAGAVTVDPAVEPPQPVQPLPAGSLSLWTEVDSEQFMLSPREGLDAVVVLLEPEEVGDPVARILAVGGRSVSGSGSSIYLASAESIAVLADGSLDTSWVAETPVLQTPRSHYALVTTQNSDLTDFPPDGDEPPCPDFDGDGYLDCSCAGLDDANADCDDHNPAINPGAAEICGDGIDQDCDGSGCGGSDGACACDEDADGDGHTSAACGGDDCCDDGSETSVLGCTPDTAAGIHPGAMDACGDGIDQDCNGIDPECLCQDDEDGDGHVSLGCGGDDCCDNGADTSLGCTDLTADYIYPGATEYCEDGVDENCDGEDPRCVPRSTYWPLRTYGQAASPGKVAGHRAPRVLAGGKQVYIVAVMGDADWSDVANGGLTSFEACPVNEDGHLLSSTDFWYMQTSTSNQQTFGLDAVLYFNYLYPFWGVASETYDPSSSRSLVQSTIRRYPVADPDDVTPGNEAALLGTRQSASTTFEVPRSHYKMLRLMSYIYVVGGWADAHEDFQGNPVSAGPVGEMERHVQ